MNKQLTKERLLIMEETISKMQNRINALKNEKKMLTNALKDQSNYINKLESIMDEDELEFLDNTSDGIFAIIYHITEGLLVNEMNLEETINEIGTIAINAALGIPIIDVMPDIINEGINISSAILADVTQQLQLEEKEKQIESHRTIFHFKGNDDLVN